MEQPKTYRAIVNRYKGSSKEIQKYFEYLPSLIEKFPLEISLSYLFARVELAQNMMLYCGAVKLHKTHNDPTWNIVMSQHMTREQFKTLFEAVFGQPLPKNIVAKIQNAEKIRDRVMHGKIVGQQDQRDAIANVLLYAEALNEFIYNLAKFKPFGKLQGYKGRLKPLDAKTSRLVLKGLGFPMS